MSCCNVRQIHYFRIQSKAIIDRKNNIRVHVGTLDSAHELGGIKELSLILYMKYRFVSGRYKKSSVRYIANCLGWSWKRAKRIRNLLVSLGLAFYDKGGLQFTNNKVISCKFSLNGERSKSLRFRSYMDPKSIEQELCLLDMKVCESRQKKAANDRSDLLSPKSIKAYKKALKRNNGPIVDAEKKGRPYFNIGYRSLAQRWSVSHTKACDMVSRLVDAKRIEKDKRVRIIKASASKSEAREIMKKNHRAYFHGASGSVRVNLTNRYNIKDRKDERRSKVSYLDGFGLGPVCKLKPKHCKDSSLYVLQPHHFSKPGGVSSKPKSNYSNCISTILFSSIETNKDVISTPPSTTPTIDLGS